MPVHPQTLKHIADEPYRIFFPFALLAGILGAMLWPLYYAAAWEAFPQALHLHFYPNIAHAHVMIEGFVGGFAVGFVGTAMPKLLSAPSLKTWQVLSMLALHLALICAHLADFTRIGDTLFALMMTLFVACLLVRVKDRKNISPPGMLLAGMGILCGTLGAAWMAATGLANGNPVHYLFAQRLLYQAFILLPLLGIGAYIFPMILGTPNYQAQLNENKASKKWKNNAIECILLSILIILTYWIEVQNGSETHIKSMSWVRFALCFVWLTKESGWLQRNTTAKGIMPFTLRAGIFCLLSGMILTGILSQHRIALSHDLYIGGFGLISMIVAARVLYAHGGQDKKYKLWIKPLNYTTGLLLFTMFTRVTADFMPKITISHHIYAALLWVIVCFIWGFALLPLVKKHPAPSITPKKKKSTPSLININFRK